MRTVKYNIQLIMMKTIFIGYEKYGKGTSSVGIGQIPMRKSFDYSVIALFINR